MNSENIYPLILKVYKQSVILSILSPFTIILDVILLYLPLIVSFAIGVVLTTLWLLVVSRTIRLYIEILHFIKKNA